MKKMAHKVRDEARGVPSAVTSMSTSRMTTTTGGSGFIMPTAPMQKSTTSALGPRDENPKAIAHLSSRFNSTSASRLSSLPDSPPPTSKGTDPVDFSFAGSHSSGEDGDYEHLEMMDSGSSIGAA